MSEPASQSVAAQDEGVSCTNLAKRVDDHRIPGPDLPETVSKQLEPHVREEAVSKQLEPHVRGATELKQAASYKPSS